MKTAVLSVTTRGAKLGQAIRRQTGDHVVCYEKAGKESGEEAKTFAKLGDVMPDLFVECDRILCIMAVGIVVRVIAPYIRHKSKDPAVVVMDEQGLFAISLLSGHLGGANEWTLELAQMTQAVPVVTTATDVNGLPAPDVLARKLLLTVDDFRVLVKTNAAIVAGQKVEYYVDDDLPLIEEYQRMAKEEHITLLSLQTALFGEEFESDEVRVVITDKCCELPGTTLYLRPKTIVVGVGCRRNTPEEFISQAVFDSLRKVNISPKSVLCLTSVDVKADEKGLLDFATRNDYKIEFFNPTEMKVFVEENGLTESNFVKDTIGVGNVCETTSLMKAKSQILLQMKTIYPSTTVAIAAVNLSLSELDRAMRLK